MTPTKFSILMWGDFACFTKPDAKVERLSYPVPTPSAARGMIDSIYVKPEKFRNQIDSIKILNPIKFISLMRNEVKDKASYGKPIYADLTDDGVKGRTQRQSMILKDVAYVIKYHIHAWPGQPLEPLEQQMFSRLKSGQQFQMPYFGCKEFIAFWSPLLGDEPAPQEEIDLDVGMMLYDVFDLSRPVTGVSPSFFKASVEKNILTVPPYNSKLVFKRA